MISKEGYMRLWRPWLMGVCAVLWLVVSVYLIWPIAMLEVREGELGENPRHLMLARGIHQNQELELGYIHSWYQVPQIEHYLFRAGQLVLTSVFFGSHDALDYYDPLAVYPRRAVPGGYEVSVDSPVMRPVTFAMGHKTRIWLRMNKVQPISLNNLFPAADGFSLSVMDRPRFIAWIMEISYEGF